MKHLVNYIFEALRRWKTSDNYKEVATEVCDELVDTLPKCPNHKDNNLSSWEKVDAGKWWWNKGDIVRYKSENTKYVGYKIVLMTTLDLGSNNINKSTLSRAIEQLFNTTIEESVFDNNINKKMPEYEYINKMYLTLVDFFKTKDFSNVPFVTDEQEIVLSGRDLNQLHTRPTMNIDGWKVALWNVIADKASYNEEKYSIQVTLFIYEDKK